MVDFSFSGPRGPITGTKSGSGPCLILLAGIGSTHRLWGEFPAHLSRNLTVVTIDNRGVGGSRGGDAFTIDGAAEDIVTLLDHLKQESARVLGASMGGLIALRTALKAPERIDRMVVLSSAARMTSHGRRSIGLLRTMLIHLPPEEFGRNLMTLAFAPPFQTRLPSFVDQAGDLFGLDPADVPGAIAQAEAMLKGWDVRSALRSLPVPALVIAGERDPIVAMEDTREIAVALPFSEFIQVPDAGHSVLAEGGRTVFDRVLSFLRPAAGNDQRR